MSKILGTRSVLAVRDLKKSTDYYVNVLGFEREPVDAEGWSFLHRDRFHVMLGECPDERPASELGNHSYYVYVEVDDVDRLHDEVSGRGAEIIQGPASKPWGMREFAVRTVDGHRIMFGQDLE